MAMESESLALDRKLVDISLDYFLKDPSLGKYFLYDDKNREGSCFITYEKNIYYDADILWFQSVNVKKDYRKQGVFRRMFQEVERLGKSLNTSLKLYVEVENHTAIAVYKKMNMERVN